MTGNPEPRHVPVPHSEVVGPTGHGRVDAVLDRAAELDRLPVSEHPGHYEVLHAALVAELDAEPGTVPAGLVQRTRTGQGTGPR